MSITNVARVAAVTPSTRRFQPVIAAGRTRCPCRPRSQENSNCDQNKNALACNSITRMTEHFNTVTYCPLNTSIQFGQCNAFLSDDGIYKQTLECIGLRLVITFTTHDNQNCCLEAYISFRWIKHFEKLFEVMCLCKKRRNYSLQIFGEISKTLPPFAGEIFT